VLPERLEAAGFEFRFRDHESALADIIVPRAARP